MDYEGAEKHSYELESIFTAETIQATSSASLQREMCEVLATCCLVLLFQN